MDIFKNDLGIYYSSGKSMAQISKLFGCSTNKIVYWMSKYKIARRTRSEAMYMLNNPDGDPFNLQGINNLSNEEMYLYGLGIGLYWGEGEKTTKHAIRVANSDPYIIIKFREFLIKICKFKISRIGYSLISFNDIDPKIARKY